MKTLIRDEYYCNISGTISGPEAGRRQQALRILEESGIDPVILEVVPEPENPYDPDALGLWTEVPSMGRVQLGYVPNARSVCDFCCSTYQRHPGQCRTCKRKDHLRRTDTASKVAPAIRKDPGSEWYAELVEFTGGEEERPSRGAMIVIRRT